METANDHVQRTREVLREEIRHGRGAEIQGGSRAATSCLRNGRPRSSGLSGPAVDDYVKAVRKADLAEKGDEDVFRKMRKDFDDKGVRVPDAELRKAISDFLHMAVQQIETEAKSP